jgi:peptidyl-prolyl cis-trans isomerase B (cyclophilin B)
MAKHKAPTQITIAAIEEKTAFHEFVDRYWKIGVGLVIVAGAAILIPHYQKREAEGSRMAVWDELRSQVNLGSGAFGQIEAASPSALAGFADQHKGQSVGAWAKALEIGSLVEARNMAGARRASEELEKEWPDHLLTSASLVPTAAGAVPLTKAIATKEAALEAWEKEHAFLFSNPALPQDAPRVRVNTTKGSFVLGLYSDRVPTHVAGFLAHCKDAYFDGTKFHRIVRGSLIQGGDPNTREGEPDTWGKGGPEEVILGESDPRLHHFKGTLSAWKAPGASGSHGSQFFITTADQHQFDGQYVVFGQVVEGMSTVEAIEAGAVVGEVPQDPAVIESVEIL